LKFFYSIAFPIISKTWRAWPVLCRLSVLSRYRQKKWVFNEKGFASYWIQTVL
jgi:hypothetical protein